MTTQIFYPKLNEFCRKYLVTGTPESVAVGRQEFARLHGEMAEEIFEHFMLFDSIAFKVHGENVPLAFLRGTLGEYGFDALLDQKAIKFVLWTPMVGFAQQDIPGLYGLVHGNLSSGPHSDPEASIETGLKFINPALPRQKRRYLMRKLLPLYVVPPDDLAGKAVEIAQSAYVSGKLTSFGFSPETQPLTNLPLDARSRLSSCAQELLEYRFLLERGMTSYSNFQYFSLFTESLRRVGSLKPITGHFEELAKLEGIPNLRSVFSRLDKGLQQLPKLRATRNARKFREWLSTVEHAGTGEELARAYVDSVADAKGLFDSRVGKFSKSVLMTAVGAGIGFAIDQSLEGVAGGALATKVLEPVADLGLDLLDAYLLEGLTKGWTPRMFIDDLRKFQKEDVK